MKMSFFFIHVNLPDETYDGGLFCRLVNCDCDNSGYAVFNCPVVGIVYTTVLFEFSTLFANKTQREKLNIFFQKIVLIK